MRLLTRLRLVFVWTALLTSLSPQVWSQAIESADVPNITWDTYELTKCRLGVFSDGYVTDKNFDGKFTISDLNGVLSDILAIPADALKGWTYATDVGEFFENRCAQTRGWVLLLSALAMTMLTLIGFALIFGD